MATEIDTGRIQRSRTLRFDSIDQVIVEVDRLVDAELVGMLKCCGNWTLGQTFGHLAAWVEYSFTGAPMKPPWLVKLFMRTFVGKNKFINEPMRAGVKIPRTPDGTLGTEVMSTEAGAARYKAALQRLVREAPTKPNILFGPLTHEEWIKLNLRHAELHLSFAAVQ